MQATDDNIVMITPFVAVSRVMQRHFATLVIVLRHPRASLNCLSSNVLKTEGVL